MRSTSIPARTARRLAAAAAIALMGIGLGACGGDGGEREGAGQGADSRLIPIRIGVPRADYYPLYVARDQGLFEQAGLKPRFFFFTSGAPLLAALKSKSVDAINTGLGSMFALGQGVDLTFLMWHIDDAAGEGLVATPDSGITSFRDIAKAETLASATGTCANVNLYLGAQKAGVPWDSLKKVNVPPPLYDSAMKQGSIDGGIAWAPFGQQLEARGVAKIVNWDEDYDGVCPVTTAVRTEFLKENPEVGAGLIKAQDLALKQIERNPQLGIDALRKELKLSPEAAKASFDRLQAGFPTFEKQLDPSSEQSIVSPNGLAAQLHKATVALAATGSIPKPLSQQELFERIDSSYMKKHVEGEQ